MVRRVVKFGTPVLRQKGPPVGTVTPAIRQLIADMIETMYAHKGVGLAAQQVGVALQLTVTATGVTPATMPLSGGRASVEADRGVA